MFTITFTILLLYYISSYIFFYYYVYDNVYDIIISPIYHMHSLMHIRRALYMRGRLYSAVVDEPSNPPLISILFATAFPICFVTAYKPCMKNQDIMCNPL